MVQAITPVIFKQKKQEDLKFFSMALQAPLKPKSMQWKEGNKETEVEGMPRVYSLHWVQGAVKRGLMVHAELLSYNWEGSQPPLRWRTLSSYLMLGGYKERKGLRM